jgi:nucleoside 2-deoxyribosyltransferase
MTHIYIASPYSIGDPHANVRAQIDAAGQLIALGYCPVVPLLSHYIHERHPQDYETWMEIDFELLSRCDVVLRLPGKSNGADREVNYATALKIPVVYSITKLLELTA